MLRKNRKLLLFLSVLFVLISLLFSLSGSARIKEKRVLMRSSFGDFTKADRIRKQGKAVLEIWPSYVQYCKRLPVPLKKVACLGVETLPIEFDEMWVSQTNNGTISKLYWRGNVVQAFTSEYLYARNPYTGKKLSRSRHELISIYDREGILSRL